MREIIVGTAGHIDHGKTALVEALTGINTDRLKEEKIRGITIELGFAHMTLPSGQRIGIVDVPGHERFVKTMVAGAAGIDLVILVVAADEGVMPQTREHMDICRLLRVDRGLVALTKTDLVEQEWLQLVEEDIREFVRGTFLEGAPVVRTSKVTGRGFDELVQRLDELCRTVGDRPQGRFFRLPIDRVFTMKGFGTVVTGTLLTGRIVEGQVVEVAPKGIRSKVRGLQVHNQPVKEAHAGMRTAVNLQGLEKEELERGDLLIPPDSFQPTHMVDAYLEYLPAAPRKLKNRARIRFHAGTCEILGRAILLDRDEMEPGEQAYVQIRLEAPTVLVHGDPFVLRSYSPVQTIGGGTILDGLPRKHKRNDPSVLTHLESMHTGELPEVAALMIVENGLSGLTRADLDRRLNFPEERWREILSDEAFLRDIRMIDSGAASPQKGDAFFVSAERVDQLERETLSILEGFHKNHPLEPGIPKDDLLGRFKIRPPARLFNHILQVLQQRGAISVDADRWRLAAHRVDLGRDQEERRAAMETAFLDAALQPPTIKELAGRLRMTDRDARQLAELMVRQGTLVKVKEDLYFHARAVGELRGRLVGFLKERGEIQPLEFKEMTRLSRKFMIPLLEYFDRVKLTMRVGDKRVLRK